ncbi:MAG: HDIG domain-containing protein [Bacteroidetes bacterium]|nr:HDIG domain-containing protein [Bacteroidota bacterium]HET6243439.1 HDIG domain-containing protein [Bacteroidia bacterium]
MKNILAFFRDKHDEIFKGFIFLISVILIVSVFPKEGKFRYEFTKGKPWLHQDLIASFDFAIKKTEEEIKKEQVEITANSQVFFQKDTAVLINLSRVFDRDFAVSWNKKYNYNSLEDEKKDARIKQATFKKGHEILIKVFSRGIIEVNDFIERKSSSEYISLVNNNVAEEKQILEFHTLQTAYDFIHLEIEKENKIDGSLLTSLLENIITHNIIYDEHTTKSVLNQQLEQISLIRGKIQQGERIISKGELIDSEKFLMLESFRTEYLAQTGGVYNYLLILSGQLLLVSLALLVIYFFIYLFRKDILADNLKVGFLLFVTVLMVFMASLSLKFEFVNIYALPFGILPIVIRAFYDTRLALFTHLVTCLVLGFLAPNGFEFAFIQLLAGIFAVFSIVNMSKRSQLFFTSFIIFTSYSLTYLGFAIIEEGEIHTVNPVFFGYFGISAMLTLFSYPLIYLFEKVFGFISDVTLIELSDTNSPLLRELAMRAPGTFQHSLQVANLAEEATFEIGGDTLLVRAAALYHDIGKMDMPRYFIENQTSGINPHDELNFDESAEIIISHVIKGVEKAKKYNLPEKVIDFIRTHHGDSTVQYFYKSFLKQFPDKLIDEKKFRYPGPRPYSKETAVLMMADSVEAASRSLKSYDSESIDKLVENVINSQIADNQFVNADITFKDITVIKKILKKKLLTIYHVRIEYPK